MSVAVVRIEPMRRLSHRRVYHRPPPPALYGCQRPGEQPMSVTYVGFGGKSVSREWADVLNAASREVPFMLDSGHRTMSEQQGLYNTFLTFGHPLAARSAPT